MGNANVPISKAIAKFIISKDVETKLKYKKATFFNLYDSGSEMWIFLESIKGKKQDAMLIVINNPDEGIRRNACETTNDITNDTNQTNNATKLYSENKDIFA